MSIKYFSAPWCAPCKAILPKIRALAASNGLSMTVYDIETPEGSVEASKHHILNVPTIVMSDGSMFNPAQMPWPVVKKVFGEQAHA